MIIDYSGGDICAAVTKDVRCAFAAAARCSDGTGNRFGLCPLHLLVRNSGLDRDPLPGDALVMNRKYTLWAREGSDSNLAIEEVAHLEPGTMALVLHVDDRHWFYVTAAGRIGWLAPDGPSQVVKGNS